MRDKVCACIITYNIDKKIIEVVNSIINQVEYVIIVDNASNKKTIEILNQIKSHEKLEVILNESNNGIAKALNQGIEIAKKKKLDWIITLDHDSICNKDMISNMIEIKESYENKESIAILTPQVFEIHKRDFISNKNNVGKYTEVNECIQSGALIKVSLFEEVGCFNEDLFIYHVDFDFCKRVLNKGYKIIQCNNTILYHEEGYKIPKRFLGKKTFYNNYSSVAIYYITRNTVYMSKKYSVFYLKRIVKDYIYILLYDENRKEKLSYLKKGLYDGIFNRYGKLKI